MNEVGLLDLREALRRFSTLGLVRGEHPVHGHVLQHLQPAQDLGSTATAELRAARTYGNVLLFRRQLRMTQQDEPAPLSVS